MEIKKPIRKKRFESLDAFRGLFALMVVIYHMEGKSLLTNNFFTNHSFIFVDYFFVLSGFVMTYSYGKKLLNIDGLKLYLKKRTARLYPLHLYTLFVFLLLEFAKVPAFSNGLINNPAFDSNNLNNFVSALLMLNSTGVGISSGVGWNYPSWSISAEYIAYIVFGATFLFNRKRNDLIFYLSLTVAFLITIYIVNGSWNILVPKEYRFLRGLFGFFVGITTYLVAERVQLNFSKIIFSISELTSIILLVLLMYYWKFIADFTVIFSLLFSITILIYSEQKGIVSKLLIKPFFQMLGLWSYSIYLNHAIVIYVLEFLGYKILKLTHPLLVNAYILLMLVVTIVYSKFTYEFIEKRYYKSSALIKSY